MKTVPSTPMLAQPVATSRATPRLWPYAALGLAVLCLGMSAIFVKWAGVPGGTAAFYRVAIGLLVLAGPFFWGRWGA